MKRPAIIAYIFLLIFYYDTCFSTSSEANNNTPGWKSRVEISFVDTKGNTRTQTFSGKIDMQKRTEVNHYFFIGMALHGTERERETANKLLLETGWEYNVTHKLFSTVAIGYLRDKFSGYEYRVYGGPGVGYTFLKSDKSTLDGFISLIYYRDKLFNTSTSDTYPTTKARLKYRVHINENLLFKENVDYFISFQNKNKYFIDNELALEVKINNSLSLGITYLLNYQNLLPSAGVRHVDTTFLTSLIIDI